jgi:hypothetical protein
LTISYKTVIPAKAGIQYCLNSMDSRFRGNDEREYGNDKRRRYPVLPGWQE